MRHGYIFAFIATLFSLALNAKIEMQGELKVEMGNSIEAIAINTEHNFLYKLSTYEWPENRGPQFQLEIMPLNSKMPAAFTADDLQDENYWEPLFRNFTKNMAGQEMVMDDNLKKLFVQDVELMPGQFASYTELHEITITSTGDFTIPDNCFIGDRHLDKMDCLVAGNLSLGQNVVPAEITFPINTFVEQNAQTWNTYRQDNKCSYTVYLNGEPYKDITPTEVKITAASLNLTGINGDNFRLDLPATGFAPVNVGKIKQMTLNSYTMTVDGNAYSADIQYRVTRQGEEPNDWWDHMPPAEQKNAGTWQWVAEEEFNLLSTLNPGDTYTLEFSFVAYHGSGMASYNNNGENYKITFTVDGSVTKFSDDVSIYYTKNGTQEVMTYSYYHLGLVSDLVLNSFYINTKGDNEAKSVTMYYTMGDNSEWKTLPFSLTSEKTWSATPNLDLVAAGGFTDSNNNFGCYFEGITSDGTKFYLGSEEMYMSIAYYLTPFTNILVDATVNGEKIDVDNLAHTGWYMDVNEVTALMLNSITVSTRAEWKIQNVNLRYYIAEEGAPYVESENWPSVPLKATSANTWTLSADANLLQGLKPNTNYSISLAVSASDGEHEFWSGEASGFFSIPDPNACGFADLMYFDLTLSGRNEQKTMQREDKIDLTLMDPLTSFVLRAVSVETTGAEAPKSVTLRYNLYEQGMARNEWKAINFVQVETNKWKAEPNINLLQGLKTKTRYNLELQLVGTDKNDQNFYFNRTSEDNNVLYFEAGTPTAIDSMSEGEKTAAVYDLQGRRVATPKAGIYIVGGRKVMMTR